MKKRYSYEIQGDTLLLVFEQIPPHGIREILHEYGYKYYHSSRTWVGKKRKEDLLKEVEHWNRRCEALSHRRETLCWSCQNACGRCEWSSRFKPVPGWKAEETIVKVQYTEAGYTQRMETQSFFVEECPKYIKDKPRKGMFHGGAV